MPRKKTHDEYVQEIAEINSNIDVVDKYINNSTSILHKCKVCNSEFKRTPNKMLCVNSSCPVCSGNKIGSAPEYKNSIWASEYKDFFAQYMTEEQMKKYMPHSSHKVSITCPDCEMVVKVSINNLSYRKFFMCYCSDGISYPNKFMYSLLDQLNVDYIKEYSPDWAGQKKYDIYIPSLNCIIENHGEQHYKDKVSFNTTLRQQQENDEYKYNLAMNNDIDEYIIIDCRNSDINFVKKSIVDSRLNNILCLDNVDWNVCDNFAISNLAKNAIKLWNDGLSFSQIREKINVSNTTLRTYLKNGCKMGLCDYSKNESYKRAFGGGKAPRALKVYCVELDTVFNTMHEASFVTGVHDSAIGLCCRDIYKTAGGYKWFYLDDYITKSGDIIKGAMSLGLLKEVV